MYVVLLRGVNLGKRKVLSAELKALATDLGHTEVSTYINSGNVICGSAESAEQIEQGFEEALAQRYGFDVDVVVRTGTQLAAVVAANPYPDGDPKQVTVGFTKAPIASDAADRLAALAEPEERFTLAEREVYVDFAGGLAHSKLATGLPKAVGQTTTARNIRTVTKLAELATAQR
ncbi:DUF1697 domain-containing protein [Microlunatus soli]|uniref:Uncharacterized conserved protein, DUF1697 family n=1 Tax=Microlunatus soli TaxID=630515 RepID=A0A1H2A5X4_9ACTN|nr:DUF1697 domain-containing protein [Microlunatus soli]SDT40846.1 Uncharacterized conserved protein, DUF1697 family [Microlunatus soli]